MEVDILELSDDKARFVLKGVNPAIANGLRKSMLSEVPTMAIDYINVYDNTSVLFDEQLGLRMGLIPLKTDLDSYVLPEDCDCRGEGCTKCQLTLTLSSEGPTMVYSGDIQSSDPAVGVAEDKIPIVELKERQKLVLEAVAKLGTGREHVKFQAGVACGYKNMPVITFSESCDTCGKCVEECPREILRIENNEVIVKDPLQCILCKLCEDACDINAISIAEDNSAYIFTAESDGSYPARELIIQSADTIIEKVRRLNEILKSIE